MARRQRHLGAAACSSKSRIMRGGIGLVAGYIGGYVLSSIMGPPAPATTTSLIPPSLLPAAPASTSLLPAGLVSMLPFIGAIGGAYIGARKPEC